MTFLRCLLASLPDRWRCFWRPLPACECDALSRACGRALHVIDLYRARCAHLTEERDQAVRDRNDLLDLRSTNAVMPLFEKETE